MDATRMADKLRPRSRHGEADCCHATLHARGCVGPRTAAMVVPTVVMVALALAQAIPVHGTPPRATTHTRTHARTHARTSAPPSSPVCHETRVSRCVASPKTFVLPRVTTPHPCPCARIIVPQARFRQQRLPLLRRRVAAPSCKVRCQSRVTDLGRRQPPVACRLQCTRMMH